MSDLIEIGIVVDSKPVNNLVAALGKASNAADLADKNFRSLEKALKQGIGSGADNLLKAFSRLERAGMSLSDVNKGLAQDAKMLAQANQAQVNSLLNVDRASKSARNSAEAMKEAFREQALAATAAAKAARTQADVNRKLRMEFREGYAAQVQLRAAQMRLNQARREGIVTDQEYQKQLARLNLVNQGNVKGTNNLGVMMQQTGYQVGDFAVQVQSGTNVAVAFGQQATQLVGALYLLPAPLLAAKVGILGLSISVTALIASFSIILPIVTGVVAYFMRTAEASRNAKEKVNSFEDALSSARTQLQGMKEDLRLLQSGLQSAFVLTLSDEVDKAREALSEAREELNALYTQEFAVGESLANVVNLDDYEESIRLAKDRLLTATIELSTAQELSRQEKQRARDASIANQLYEARVILAEQMVDNQETLKEGAQGFLDIWTSITSKIGESVDKIIAANLELKVLNSANRASVTTYGGRGSGAEYNRPAPSGAFVPTQETLDAYNKMMGLSGKTASRAAAQVDELQQEIDKLNETASKGLTPFDKYNKAIDHLNKLRSEGLSSAAYSMEIERLNEELAKSLPMVNDVADAFGDFLARGLTDFKSFANSIFKSFQNMLAQMITTAARNRILISMGATGSMAGPASAASNLAQGAGMLGGVGAFASGIGSGLGVVGNGFMAGGFSGAATATAGAVSGGIGMGGAAGFGTALGAAIPVIGAVALVFGALRKTTKELDSGLNVTIKNMDALVTSFKTVETSRFFGLSKKTSTSTGGVSSGVSDPIVAAVQQIQQSVLTAAEAFGFGADAFDNFSYEFKLSLKGLSEEQQMQKINEELAKMGDSFASLTGHFSSMNELLEAAEQRYQIENRMLQALGNSSELLARSRERELAATHALNRGLLQATFNLEDAQAAVTNAFTGLRAAIDKVVTELQAKLSVANEAVNRSRSIFNQLESALSGRSLTSGIGQTFARREGALGFLKGGDFSDEKKLDEALRVVSEPTEDLFGSFVDYAREFATTSRTLEEAKKVAQTQLTADEQQVMLLEQQIASAEAQYQVEVDQYNALMGIDTSVKSVGDAIATLRGAIESLASAQAAAKAAAAMPAPSAPAADQTAAAAADYQLVKEGKYWVQRFSDGDYFRTGHRNEALAAQSAKIHADQKAGQQFARGGMFNGGMRLVGEEGPELEVTGPSRIYSKQQTKELLRGGDSSDGEGLRAEVSEMRQELRQLLIANNKYTKRSYDLYNKWDIDGLPAERT